MRTPRSRTVDCAVGVAGVTANPGLIEGASCRLCGLCAQPLEPGDFAGYHPWCLGDVVARQPAKSGGPSCPTCGERIGERDYASVWPFDSECACPPPADRADTSEYRCYACESSQHDRPGPDTGCGCDERWFRRYAARQQARSQQTPPTKPIRYQRRPQRPAARGVRLA